MRIKRNQLPKSRPTLPEIGRLAIGIKAKTPGGKEYPQAVDYFVPRGRYIDAFRAKFGEKPNELLVFFPSSDFNQVCSERYEIRANGKLWGFGDGEKFEAWDGKSGKYLPCTPEECKGTLKSVPDAILIEVLYLRVMLCELNNAPLGYWQLTTKGKASSIRNLVERFDTVLATVGHEHFTRVPFLLTVKKATSNNPGGARTYPVLDLEVGLQNEHLLAVRDYGHQIKGGYLATPERAQILAERNQVLELPEANFQLDTKREEL